MIIRKKRIRKIGGYFGGIEDGTDIILGLRNLDNYDEQLKKIGFKEHYEVGDCVLPACIGPATKLNANGKEIVHRNKPKETHYRQSEWSWKEFHGPYDQVEKSRIVDIPYERYPRTPVPPFGVELSILSDEQGNKLVASESLEYSPDNEEKIICVVNVFLEIFGECEVFDSSMAPFIRAEVRRLNWEILPPGRRPWEERQSQVEELISTQPDGNQSAIRERLKVIYEESPEFVAVGRAGFHGYLVFGFPEKDLFILESTQVNNATYVFDEDWETLSNLTKAEVIQGELHKERLIHRETWFNQMKEILDA